MLRLMHGYSEHPRSNCSVTVTATTSLRCATCRPRGSARFSAGRAILVSRERGRSIALGHTCFMSLDLFPRARYIYAFRGSRRRGRKGYDWMDVRGGRGRDGSAPQNRSPNVRTRAKGRTRSIANIESVQGRARTYLRLFEKIKRYVKNVWLCI